MEKEHNGKLSQVPDDALCLDEVNSLVNFLDENVNLVKTVEYRRRECRTDQQRARRSEYEVNNAVRKCQSGQQLIYACKTDPSEKELQTLPEEEAAKKRIKGHFFSIVDGILINNTYHKHEKKGQMCNRNVVKVSRETLLAAVSGVLPFLDLIVYEVRPIFHGPKGVKRKRCREIEEIDIDECV